MRIEAQLTVKRDVTALKESEDKVETRAGDAGTQGAEGEGF